MAPIFAIIRYALLETFFCIPILPKTILDCNPGQYQVFEVSGDRIEKHDMLLLKGSSFVNCSYYANQYWSGGHTESPLYEYLIEPPVNIIRRVDVIDSLE